MQSDTNNGFIEKVPEQIWNDFNLIPWNSISAFTHLNKLYYQKEPFYSKQWSNIYTLRNKNLDKFNALFIISLINIQIKNIDYWKNTASRLGNYNITLPTQNGEINFDFMETFIRAIEKLVIKDLVIWNEKKKQVYHEIINKKN